jgi:hypothetical protein
MALGSKNNAGGLQTSINSESSLFGESKRPFPRVVRRKAPKLWSFVCLGNLTFFKNRKLIALKIYLN